MRASTAPTQTISTFFSGCAAAPRTSSLHRGAGDGLGRRCRVLSARSRGRRARRAGHAETRPRPSRSAARTRRRCARLRRRLAEGSMRRWNGSSRCRTGPPRTTARNARSLGSRTRRALIGRFCQTVEDATRAAYGPPPLRRYDADLIVPRGATRMRCAQGGDRTLRHGARRRGHAAGRAAGARCRAGGSFSTERRTLSMLRFGRHSFMPPTMRPSCASSSTMSRRSPTPRRWRSMPGCRHE